MKVQYIIKDIKEKLAPLYSPSECQTIVKIIFDNLMHYSPVDLVMKQDEEVSDFIEGKIDNMVNRLLNHEPIQYIFNEAYFHGNMLKVTPDVLIPRPETEELIDLIVSENPQSDLKVLDIGTGSGAIAVSLARSLRFPIVSAIDISPKALEVAEENATKLKVKVKFIEADILNLKAIGNEGYDIIVSNPPYITDGEKDEMEDNVLDFEPHLALFVPNNDPLKFYRAISIYAQRALKRGGKLYFEINNHFGEEMKELLKQNGFTDINIIKDMHGKDRIATSTKPQND